MNNAILPPPRWLIHAVRALQLALLAATFAVIFSELPTPIVGFLLSTLVIIRLAVAGVFGAYAGSFPLYNIPVLIRSPRCAAIFLLIFASYLTLTVLMALNGLQWHGLAAKICAGVIIASDLYLTFSDAFRGAKRRGAASQDTPLTEP